MSAEYAVYHSMVGLERVKVKRWREGGREGGREKQEEIINYFVM